MFSYAKNVRLASLRLSLALSGSYWISPCLSLALYGSLWLPLWLPLALTCSLRLSLALSGSYWISPCLSLALYGSLWLPLWLSLALTATLWPSLAHYCSLISRIQPLIGSQGPCSALIATMTHFIPLWCDRRRNILEIIIRSARITELFCFVDVAPA